MPQRQVNENQYFEGRNWGGVWQLDYGEYQI